jgi:hypothetical protein
MVQLPPLPAMETPWSPNIRNAFLHLNTIYSTASAYLETGSVEPHRLGKYAAAVVSDAFPLLLLLDESAEEENLSLHWLEKVSNLFVEILVLLDENLERARGEYVKISAKCLKPHLFIKFDRQDANVSIPQPVSIQHTGQPGRPRKNVDLGVLKEATQPGRRIPATTLSDILGIHRNTLRTIIKDNAINTGYSNISDLELDKIIRDYRKDHPSAGRGYIIGHLRSAHNLRVQRWRISKSVNRIDRLGQGMRRNAVKKKVHQDYSVDRPNALWHIDGHHKLILWGIVIHGMADGDSRTVSHRATIPKLTDLPNTL